MVGWLRQILAARLANLMRRTGTPRRATSGWSASWPTNWTARRGRWLGPGGPQRSPSQQARPREQAVLLADALERLPADYREVIVLRHLEGLTFPEVAAPWAAAWTASRNSGSAALARLRQTGR